MAILGVTRVSKAIQFEFGKSMETQEDTILNYCRYRKFEADLPVAKRESRGNLIATDSPHIDYILTCPGISASKKPFKEREADFMAMLNPGDKVVTKHLDRMCRQGPRETLDLLEHFRERRIEWHIIDPFGQDVATENKKNAMATAFFTIVSLFAQLETDRLSERITEVLEHERERARSGEVVKLAGNQHGWLVWVEGEGWKLLDGTRGLDGVLLFDAEGKPRYDLGLDRRGLLEIACTLFADKLKGPQRIAQHFNKEYKRDPIANVQMQPWKGEAWADSTIYRWFRSEALEGIRTAPTNHCWSIFPLPSRQPSLHGSRREWSSYRRG
jgi:hypothetical protein